MKRYLAVAHEGSNELMSHLTADTLDELYELVEEYYPYSDPTDRTKFRYFDLHSKDENAITLIVSETQIIKKTFAVL